MNLYRAQGQRSGSPCDSRRDQAVWGVFTPGVGWDAGMGVWGEGLLAGRASLTRVLVLALWLSSM